MSSWLHVDNISRRFGNEAVLHSVQLSLAAEQTLSILGRSGSGKTTLLKIIAGLESCDGGSVQLEGRDLAAVPPERRGIVYLYQEPLLFPHLSALENVAFGLRVRHVSEAEVQTRTREMLGELGLAEHARKMPHELSGGQRQRAAFGRALIVQPRLLLLDEPFGALDGETRTVMQTLYRRVVREHRIATLFVTHDLKEAIVVGDRYAHLSKGHLTQYADLPAFLAEPEIRAAEEIQFWTSLAAQTGQPATRPETIQQDISVETPPEQL
jgi:ABC-type Fe3+/spermidine/putrescine transport system ATPase subunit